ncbi:MAG: hypothetical protein AB1698_03540 [Pseudomonadota bacterium]
MKYQAPFGSADPNASYVDRNTPGAIRGSVPPAAAIEDPQRELALLIEKSGFVPTDADLTQVLLAVRAQRLNWTTPAGSANALTVTLDPAPASLAALVGVPIRLKIATTNTSAATLSVNGLTATSIVRPSGVTLQAGDLVAGGIVTVVYDGTVFRTLFLPNFGVTGTPAGGWTRFPNGLILQTGAFSSSSGGAVGVTYPIAFPTAALSVVITDNSSPVTASQMSVFGPGSITVTGFQAIATRDFANNVTDSAQYIAVGH